MLDSSHHGGRPADPDPPGELAGRLLRRAAGSVGIIDARWAQRRFAHATDWIAERFAVLGLLNSRYGTVDNQSAGTSTALPVVHGSFNRKGLGTPPHESSLHAPDNESSPRVHAVEAFPRTTSNEESPHAPDKESSPRAHSAEVAPRTTENERSSRTADIESSLRIPTGEAPPRTTDEDSARTADDRTPTSGRARIASEIPTSPRIGGGLINTVVQRKSGTPSPNAALPSAELMRTASEKSQSSPTPKSQRHSVREFAPHARIEHTSPQEPPSEVAARARTHQQSPSNTAPDIVNTQPAVEVRETVAPPHATHEPTLRVDARAESQPPVAADQTVASESSEPNRPPSLEQHRAQPSQTASPLPLRETATKVSRVARAASELLAMRDETFERGGRESESPVSGAGYRQGGQSGRNSVLPVAVEQTATGHHSHLNAPLQQRRREAAQTAAEHRPQHDQRALSAEIAPPTVQARGVRAHPPVSAPEVLRRPSQLSGARMIWRKGFGVPSLSAGDAGQPGVPRPYSAQSVSSWQTLQRAEATPADSRAASGDSGSLAPAAPTQSGAGGMDLEQITEHVSRVILRRVSVERERRGIGRWL